MSKKLKRAFAGLLAFVMMFAMGTAAAPTAEAKAEEKSTTAYLAYADETWTNQYWGETESETGVKFTNATVTGAGAYTVGLDFTGTASGSAKGIAFSAVIMADETVFPGAIITVDSIKINDEVVEMGKSYTNNESGAIRSNVYWTFGTLENQIADPANNVRTVSGDLTDCTPTLAAAEAFADVKTIEVNFTVTLESQAFICYVNGDWSLQYWGGAALPEGVTATCPAISGEGTYTAGLDFTGTANGYVDGVSFAALMLDRGEIVYPGYVMNIDSILVNGEEVEYGVPYTTYDGDGTNQTRVNLFNEWVTDVTTVADVRTANGSRDGITPTILDRESMNGVETLEVVFTLMQGTEMEAEPTPQPVKLSVDKSGKTEYHAYIGIQSENWSFRNSWDDATYGIESDVFNQITGWDEANNPLVREGKINDAVIKGNGTYTVSMEGVNFNDGSELLNLLFISTDIPNTDEIKITDIKIKMNGKTVYKDFTEAFLDPDSKNYMKPLFINKWNNALTAAHEFAYTIPGDVEITFTVSGFDVDNPDSAAAEPTAAPATTTPADNSEEKGGVNGLVIAAVVVVLCCGGGFVVMKNKKKK